MLYIYINIYIIKRILYVYSKYICYIYIYKYIYYKKDFIRT